MAKGHRAVSIFSKMFGWRPPRRRLQGATARAGVGGYFSFRHTRGGIVIADFDVHNLVVDAGLAALAARLHNSPAIDPFEYLAIGEGDTAPVGGDTALEDEITTGGGERALATLSRVTDSVTNDSARLVKTFTFSDDFEVAEAGAFNDAAVGIMLARQTFTPISVVPTDTLQLTYTFPFAPA